MSGFHARAASARLSASGFGLLVCLMLGGCYTRQIEGIQKDIDSLDRKLHSISLKSKEATAAKGATPAVLQLEDRLNQVTLQQSDLAEEVSLLRQDSTGAKGGPASGSGDPLDRKKLSQIEKQVAENSRRTDSVQREVSELKTTFDSMRSETKTLIQLLKEEFGGGEEILPTSGSSNHASSSTKSTTVEEPQAPKQEGHASLVPEDPADSAVRSVPVPVASAGTRTYQVRPRDTLGGIAKKFGVSAEEIKSLNQIQDPKDLRLGQTLRIPAS